MKKFLTHFQNNLIAGMVLLCNVAALPNEFNPILYDADTVNSQPVQTSDSEIASQEETEENANEETEDEDLDSEDPEELELFDFEQDLIIRAINPGYTIDKVSNVGELIELQNLADADLELAGYELRYVNSAGNPSTLFTFPEGSYMAGKHLLLRYYGAPERDAADANYKGGLAMAAGPLQLVYDGEVVDEVCWTGKADCVAAFKNDNKAGTAFRTTLVRNLYSGEFEHLRVADYEPEFDAAHPSLVMPPEPDEEEPPEEILEPQCRGLEFSEILTYYVDDKTEQFIEVFNSTSEEIKLDGCMINYKKKDYKISGTVGAGKYWAIYQSGLFAMTKNPTNPITLTLIDVNGEVVDEMAYSNGQKKSTTYARVYDGNGNDSWQITYAPTPNAENIYQQFRNCEDGKIINEATGNCVKITSVKSSSGMKSASSSVLAPCPEGKYRNPLTGRCKKIETASSSTLKECAEGYERNPETNRCRKVKTPNEGAEYALVPNTRSEDKTVFIGAGIVAIIMAIGMFYVGLQFRHEIARATRVAGQRLNHIRQNLLARGFGRDRHKKP